MLHRAEGTVEDDGLAVETLDYQLAHLHPGAHVCPIYTTPAEQMRVLAAFSRGALIHHERLVLIVDQISVERIFAALEERGLDLAAARDQGSVVVIDDRQHLLRDGRLDADVFLHIHRGLSDEARQQGYAGLRVACDANWMFGEPFDRAALLDLEVRLNHPDQTGGTTTLCQYDRYGTPPQILHDVLRTHPLAVVGEHLHDNLYYDPIDPTDDSRATEQRRVEWMLSRLESLTRRQYALVDLGRIALAGPAQIDLLLSAAALVAAEVRVDYVEIVELLPTGNEMRRLVGLGLPGASSGTVEQIEVNGPLASSALRAGQPLIVTDWDAETRFEEPTLLREAAVHSTVSVLVSIGFGEQLFGVLSVHNREPRTFSEDEILFLQSVAVILAHAIAAARHEASFQTLVEHAPDAIARLDRTLHIIYVNPTVERLTGVPVDELVGRPWSDIGVSESQIASGEVVLRQALRTGREQTTDLTLHGNRGDCYFETRVVPESGADGTPQSLLLIAHDISQQRQTEAARAELYRELISQQGRMQELMGRLVEERETALKRLGYAEQAEHLSVRERQILQFLATGQTNREIGENLSLSAGTVKNYVARILGKLDVADRTQAAVRAVELGLVSLDQ